MSVETAQLIIDAYALGTNEGARAAFDAMYVDESAVKDPSEDWNPLSDPYDGPTSDPGSYEEADAAYLEALGQRVQDLEQRLDMALSITAEGFKELLALVHDSCPCEYGVHC